MSSGRIRGLIAVPITSRDCDAGPLFPFCANTVACGVITPSHPPDHTIGIALTAAGSRLPCLISTARNA